MRNVRNILTRNTHDITGNIFISGGYLSILRPSLFLSYSLPLNASTGNDLMSRLRM